jgi:hypothetical protein
VLPPLFETSSPPLGKSVISHICRIEGTNEAGLCEHVTDVPATGGTDDALLRIRDIP